MAISQAGTAVTGFRVSTNAEFIPGQDTEMRNPTIPSTAQLLVRLPIPLLLRLLRSRALYNKY